MQSRERVTPGAWWHLSGVGNWICTTAAGFICCSKCSEHRIRVGVEHVFSVSASPSLQTKGGADIVIARLVRWWRSVRSLDAQFNSNIPWSAYFQTLFKPEGDLAPFGFHQTSHITHEYSAYCISKHSNDDWSSVFFASSLTEPCPLSSLKFYPFHWQTSCLSSLVLQLLRAGPQGTTAKCKYYTEKKEKKDCLHRH